MSSIQQLPIVDENNNDHDSLEDNALFTPDLEYYTPSNIINIEEEEEENVIPYQSRTLLPVNKTRCTILPMYLPSSFMSNEITSMIGHITSNPIADNEDDDEPSLLLTNVPVHQLNKIQKARRLINAYNSTFEFTSKYLHLINDQSDSFISSIYHQLLIDLSLRWNMNIFVLDYNLARLRKCAYKCQEQLYHRKTEEEEEEEEEQEQEQQPQQFYMNTFQSTTFTIEELPLALEFYLQIDVDMFYMKTCTFRQAQAIQEHIFCSNEPQLRYGLTSCQQRSCPYCHPTEEEDGRKLTAIQFHSNQMHQFINGYQAILNCPVTCETSNVIYVLTCPCGQVDYIGYTSMSFRDCLAYHRNEGNRIIREFFIGGLTTNRILQGIKSDATKRNDKMLLYQHSARCSVALQLFLDVNPDFWCLVPMKSNELFVSNDASNISIISETTTATSVNNNKRLNAFAQYLTDGIPKPPFGYMFSERQENEQVAFFRNKKDQLQSSPSTIKNIDLFNATIVAVLPENCSTMLCQFVLSLFITHAECKLNESNEKLLPENIHRHYPFRGTWCENLIRRTSST